MPKSTSVSTSSHLASSSKSRSETAYTPQTYRATKNEVGVFTTPPYSERVKPLWRFKDASSARESSGAISKVFEEYREQNDFVGMDICRKFIQMGRTRSLRYALRPSGRKYTSQGEEMARTGEIYDQGKLDGAGIFERVLEEVWQDEVYISAFEQWKERQSVKCGNADADGDGDDKAMNKRKTKVELAQHGGEVDGIHQVAKVIKGKVKAKGKKSIAKNIKDESIKDEEAEEQNKEKQEAEDEEEKETVEEQDEEKVKEEAEEEAKVSQRVKSIDNQAQSDKTERHRAPKRHTAPSSSPPAKKRP